MRVWLRRETWSHLRVPAGEDPVDRRQQQHHDKSASVVTEHLMCALSQSASFNLHYNPGDKAILPRFADKKAKGQQGYTNSPKSYNL